MDRGDAENTNPITLSIPGTPSVLSARRASTGVQMSAKLAALRGENVSSRDDGPVNNGDYQVRPAKKEKQKRRVVRFMQKNGRCNIRQDSEGIHKRYLRDIFTTLVDMRWRSNLLFFIATYLTAWSFFGLLWWFVAYLRGDVAYHYEQKRLQALNLTSVNATTSAEERVFCVDNVYSYTTAFLFFVETETSLGYGQRAITDKCPEAIILFVIQSLLASILDAFMLGSIFIKISQPKNRAETLVFSEHCVISPRDRKYCLMFRVGNLRNSLIVQCRIRAKYVKSRETKEGEFIGLHQDDINVGFDTGADNLFLVTPLIICHEIDEKSPLYAMSSDDLRKEKFEIIVILEGMIESTGMICQARTSYLSNEILWGHRFMPVLFHARGHFRVDHSEFHSIYEVSMPRISMLEYKQLCEESTRRDEQNGAAADGKAPKSVGMAFHQQQRSSPKGAQNNQWRKQQTLLDDKAKRDVRSNQQPEAARSSNMDSFKVNSTTKRTLSEANVSAGQSPSSVVLINEKAHTSCSSVIVQRRFDNRDDYNERRKSEETSLSLLNADLAL